MAEDPDREALSWSGETDPTHVSAPARVSEKKVSSTGSQPAASSKKPLHPAVLVVLGILAGVYLLYAAGWAVLGFVNPVPVQGVFFSIMYQVGEALAIASPFIWAIAVWLRVKKIGWRLLWLFVGVLVLAPWPILFGGLG